MRLFRLLVILVAATLGAPAAAQSQSDMNAQILREKIKADKKLVVAENMQLTEAEAKAFWPVYEAYQRDLDQINARLGRAITAYAEAYKKGPIPDDVAQGLLDEAIAIEEAEVALKKGYVPRLNQALPPAKTARYMQIESKIRALVRMELADNIPLVQ